MQHMSQERAHARQRSAVSKFIASIDESNKCRKKAEMLTGVASVLGTDVSHYRTRYSILALNA
jgi:hypothetical protein